MILNRDRVRVIARQWKYLLVPAGLIVVVAWLMISVSTTRSGQAKLPTDESTLKQQVVKTNGSGSAQPQPDELQLKEQLVKSLYENKALNDLLEMALRNPDEMLRRMARRRLLDSQGEGSTQAMLEFYKQTSDPAAKRSVIGALGANGEIGPLMTIALSDPSLKNRREALIKIKWLKATSESAEVKAWDVSPLQAQLNEVPLELDKPPPPPPPFIDFHVEADKELKPLRWHEDGKSAFALMRQAIYAYMHRDASFFEEILDDQYIGTGVDGETRNKAQEIEEVKNHKYEIKKFEFSRRGAGVSGNPGGGFATVLGTVYFQANGKDSIAQYRFTANSLIRQGKRKIVSFHISREQ